MSKRLFRQSDVTKAAKGAGAANLSIARIEIDQNGKIVIITGSPDNAAPSPAASATEIIL